VKQFLSLKDESLEAADNRPDPDAIARKATDTRGPRETEKTVRPTPDD
jgi:hypothetical protein